MKWNNEVIYYEFFFLLYFEGRIECELSIERVFEPDVVDVLTALWTEIRCDWTADGWSDLQSAAFSSSSPWAKVSMGTSPGFL